ncbi:general transcription factor II-I repeat domain-containing protein 2-like [Octopus sinensis]|uniref:General transcription factor II-I repeat domain-containing protein 2-like n=1 Tax=Octopus sinensis TaxID=2607531 RepID=A0A6P7U0N2_9MOLL|nr:general transcription factor II-I repeat domain-containing protein 2-like [Octopus sinensis]
MPNCSKRTKDLQTRTFNPDWTHEYFFIEDYGKPICLICFEKVAVKKLYNIKRHYETRHYEKFSKFTGESRLKEIKRLEQNYQKQTTFFYNLSCEKDDITRTSYEISKIIAKRMKLFSDGEFIKENGLYIWKHIFM